MIYLTLKQRFYMDTHNNLQETDSILNSVIIVGNKAGSTYIGDCIKWSYGDTHLEIEGHPLRTSWVYNSIDKEVWNTLHKICITRNPYERFLSCWTFGQKISEQHRHNNDGEIFYLYDVIDDYSTYKPIKLKTTLEDMTQQDWQESFEEWCIRFDTGEIYDNHAHPMWNEFTNMPTDEFEFIELSKVHESETFNKIFNDEGHLRLNDFNLYEGRTLKDSKNPSQKYLPNWKDYYNDNTIEIVSRLCKKDFELLKYSDNFNDY